MSFPKYEHYKDSGVEWLGEVPAHWETKRIKHLIRAFEQGWSPQCEGYPVESSEEWGVLKVGCVNGGTFRREENKALPAEIEPVPALGISAGDLLISRANTRELVGSAAVAEEDYSNLLLCDKLYRVRLKPQVCDPRFLGLYLGTEAARGQIELAATGASSSMVNIGQSTILEMQLSLPAHEEQLQIAVFLRSETTKLDALITEQRTLIDLLKEKRQAVISHAVTKGLDPRVPMKDSGVEWLGEVPAHWRVVPLKYLVVESVAGPYGASLTKSMYTTSGYRVYGQQQVIPDDFTVGDYYISEDKYQEMRRYTVFEGDVLVSVMGTIGKVAVVPPNAEPGIINPRLVRYQCGRQIRPRFLQRVLMCETHQEHLNFEAKGSTMDGLNMTTIATVPIPVPPVEEQDQILAGLFERVGWLDSLVNEA